jgi:uncharacterized membrane protein YdbT with pleckstrin-like domain
MNYAQRVLQPGETVVYSTKLHWLVYGRAIIFLVFALAPAIGSQFVANPNLRYGCLAISALLLLAALLAFVEAWIRRFTTEIAITDRRVIFKRGLIRRFTIEMNMHKIESVDVDQSVFGRLFNFGTVVIHGTGSDVEPLRMIEDPLHFRSFVTAR